MTAKTKHRIVTLCYRKLNQENDFVNFNLQFSVSYFPLFPSL